MLIDSFVFKKQLRYSHFIYKRVNKFFMKTYINKSHRKLLIIKKIDITIHLNFQTYTNENWTLSKSLTIIIQKNSICIK